MRARRVFAIAKKELLLRLRFKWGYLFETMSTPMRLAIVFFFVYGGFFSSNGSINFGGVTKDNYVVFVLLGIVMSDIFNSGYYLMARSFMFEKFWQTIHGLLVSPARRIEMICGIGLAGLVDGLPLIVLPVCVAYLLMPISLLNVFFVVLAIFLAYLLILGFSFINAAFTLSNENYSAVFNGFALCLIFLSCFYYPITSFPDAMHPFVEANPVYQANFFVKSLWMHGSFEFWSLAYVSLMSVVSLTMGIFVFDVVLRRMGIQGY